LIHMPKPMLPKSELEKQDTPTTQPPPPPPSGVQSAQDSMRQAFHFGKNELKKDSMEQQLSNTPQLVMTENPDMKQDAKLGEEVEHVVEDHMMANKDAERKEGHPIMQKNAIGHNLKALKRCLDKCMTEKVESKEMGKPLMPAHDSSQGAPTQDEPKANRMNSENNMEKSDAKGVHPQPKNSHINRMLNADMKGVSPAGAAARASKVPELKENYGNKAKEEHKKVLGELKEMPKPNLPKSEQSAPAPKEDDTKHKGKDARLKAHLEIIEPKASKK